MTDKPVVLIVEDEPGLADSYAEFLADDYAVLTAYDGEEALDRLEEPVDVVLLDRRMPGLSGDDVLSTIEARGLDCQIAIVSAVEPDFDIVAMGFDDYVKKPVAGDELRGTVARLLTRATYDEKVQEYFAVASKRAALQEEKSPDALQGSTEFEQLEGRRQELEQELDSIHYELSDDDFSALLQG